jgi:hypothetical protein
MPVLDRLQYLGARSDKIRRTAFKVGTAASHSDEPIGRRNR